MKRYEIKTEKALSDSEIEVLERIFNCELLVLGNNIIYSVMEETSPQMGIERLVKSFHTKEEAEAFVNSITDHRTRIIETELE